MLPARHRLTRRGDFGEVTRHGSRGAGGSVVVYFLPGDDGVPARAGLIVSKRVGGSVVRHRVSRRLRAALGDLVPGLPAGARVVVRALPVSASMPGSRLFEDVGQGLRAAVARAAR